MWRRGSPECATTSGSRVAGREGRRVGGRGSGGCGCRRPRGPPSLRGYAHGGSAQRGGAARPRGRSRPRRRHGSSSSTPTSRARAARSNTSACKAEGARVVFRHLALKARHPRALALAHAAEAAAAQGAFWAFADATYADQGRLEDPHLWDRARGAGARRRALRRRPAQRGGRRPRAARRQGRAARRGNRHTDALQPLGSGACAGVCSVCWPREPSWLAPAAHAAGRCGDHPWCDTALIADARAGLLLERADARREDRPARRRRRHRRLRRRRGLAHRHRATACRASDVPRVLLSDGPVGPRQGQTTALPIPMALAATFDRRAGASRTAR